MQEMTDRELLIRIDTTQQVTQQANQQVFERLWECMDRHATFLNEKALTKDDMLVITDTLKKHEKKLEDTVSKKSVSWAIALIFTIIGGISTLGTYGLKYLKTLLSSL